MGQVKVIYSYDNQSAKSQGAYYCIPLRDTPSSYTTDPWSYAYWNRNTQNIAETKSKV